MSGSGGKSSRLEKLLNLIDASSSAETRKAAAEQIASIAAAHPGQLPAVVAAVSRHLRHNDWDARVAAGHCLGLLAEHFAHHTAADLEAAAAAGGPDAGEPGVKAEEGAAGVEGAGAAATTSSHLLSFSGFSVKQVLEQGTPMLASGGEEYELPPETASLSRAEQLRRQRGSLRQRLGLGGPLSGGGLLDTEELLRDEDLLAQPQQAQGRAGGRAGEGQAAQRAAAQGPPAAAAAPQQPASQLLASLSGLSARERAAALRRVKSLKRTASSQGGGAGPSPPKRAKGEEDAAGGSEAAAAGGGGEEGGQLDVLGGEAAQQEWAEAVEAGAWPFQPLCDQLCLQLLHPRWEVRHGAATALREVLRSQAAAAGVHAPLAPAAGGWSAPGGSGKRVLGPLGAGDAAAAAAANARWLEDCAVHLLCVLALDRFGDFVSDQVVAPVRETAAQALGAAARPLPLDRLPPLLCALRQLSEHPGEWEVRHGGLLGLKYVAAARAEGVTPQLLGALLPAAVVGLQDADSDVQAVAAEALMPAAAALAGEGAPAEGGRVLRLLWAALDALDALSPAAAPLLALLAGVHGACSGAAASAGVEGPLPPRLWPFLGHSLAAVRAAALRCLAALLAGQPTAEALPGGELGRALRLLFQTLLTERSAEVLAAAQHAWRLLVRRAAAEELAAAATTPVQAGASGGGGAAAAAPLPLLGALFRLGATPPRCMLDASLMARVEPLRRGGGKAASRARSEGSAGAQAAAAAAASQREEGLVVEGDGDAARTTRMRLAAAQALGQLCAALGASAAASAAPHPGLEPAEQLLRGPSASGRLLAAHAVACWAEAEAEAGAGAGGGGCQHPSLQRLGGVLLEVLGQAAAAAPRYSELAPLAAQLRGQASALLSRALAASLALDMPCALGVLGAAAAAALAAQVPQGAPAELALAAQALAGTAALLQTSEALLHTGAAAAAAGAVVRLGRLPPKLNALIQPLVAAVRREPQTALQDAAAAALARLALLCTQRTPCPNDKLIRNLVGFVCGDPAVVPSAAAPPDLLAELEGGGEGAAGGGGRGAARNAAPPTPQQQQEELAAAAAALARRGGEAALRGMARLAADALPQSLPRLWAEAAGGVAALAAGGGLPPADPQAAVAALRVLAVLAPAVHPQLAPQLEQLLPGVAAALQQGNAAVQAAAAAAAAALAQAHTSALMPALLRHLAPMMAASRPDSCRVGALLALHRVAGGLGLSLVPYCLLALVPLLGRVSDPHPLARALAARCLAAVVALMPLAQGAGQPPGLDAGQRALLAGEGRALLALLDNRGMEDYRLPVRLNGTLRRYQQEGLNWLAFLRRYGLHGVLADDMGLGKTLQVLALLAAHVHEGGGAAPPSLVVCPATLVAHWPHEAARWVGPVLRVLPYQGTPAERAALRPALPSHHLLVLSYDSLRADVDWVCSRAWSYCVLDEGHAIRNPASKVAQAAKRAGLAAAHRLLLSGTPVQNGVGELWSLFDFLMPGLLGSERQFHARYGRLVQAARGSKRGSAEAEAGLLAAEGLHRAVRPFILRRTKASVLGDLPPKVVQDVVVEPSALQQHLMQELQDSQALAQITGLESAGGLAGGDGSQPPHVFQALLHLRRLCSHPLLVLDPGQEAHARALRKVLGPQLADDWPAAQAALRSSLAHAPKLAALRELLLGAGIGTDPGEERGGEEGVGGSACAGHRVLVFAQLRGALDLVEECVLGPLGVPWLRIDGGVPPAERFRRVQRFNADPGIDVMLLTTATGGLGLNLTAADTVVFLEHDWNPMADLQAMDRAHRLGQRRTVNVYRLLVRGSLEERVLGLQRFKLDVAATLVNADNASVAGMDTGSLLDVMAQRDGAQAPPAAPAARADGAAPGRGGLQAVLAGAADPEASEAQYAAEFSLAAFQQKLAKQG